MAAVYEINNLVIEKGTSFDATFNLFNVDNSISVISGLTTTYASIRKHPKSDSFEEFRKTITTSTGTIELSLTEEQTARLSSGRNYFDVVLTIQGQRVKVIKGTIIVEESMSV